MELAACTDGQQMTTIDIYLNVNGARQENTGQLILTAVNESLGLVAHGCGDPIVKMEVRWPSTAVCGSWAFSAAEYFLNLSS